MIETQKPQLPIGVRLGYDDVRQQWTLFAPERVFVLDDIAAEVLKHCDGQKTLGDIARLLSEQFKAPEADILPDIVEMLKDLEQKRVLEFAA